MKTLYFSHPACHKHDPNPGHPECPERLDAIEAILKKHPLATLEYLTAPAAEETHLLLAHSQKHIDHVFAMIPSGGLNFLDADTAVCPESKEAALRAVGAVVNAVDAVLKNENYNAFCAMRPPGHHAHKNHAAGFCLFNNVAIGALSALKKDGIERVAILDFDVHHGDGTQDIVKDNPAIFFASSYQYPLYASTESTEFETGINHTVLNKPFAAGTSGSHIVDIWKSQILPHVAAFKPDMIFVSAGYDGHRDDPLAQLNFTEDDYANLMRAIKHLADTQCRGRLVTVLEGGYNLNALAESVLTTLKVLGE